MSKVVGIKDNEPHKVSEVVCLYCKHRWIAVRHIDVKLKNLECPECKRQGYVIETGEILEND